VPNSKTQWNTYRQIIQDKVNLSIKLKEHENIELEINNLLSLFQHSAKEATPNNDPQVQQITFLKRKLLGTTRLLLLKVNSILD
jgi:hypothetical protein